MTVAMAGCEACAGPGGSRGCAEHGYIAPPIPMRTRGRREWLIAQHDAWVRGKIPLDELAEHRRTVAALNDTERVEAEKQKALAAVEGARAQTKMASTLAEIEHGGAAVALLARVQESMAKGRRQALPAKVMRAVGDGDR